MEINTKYCQADFNFKCHTDAHYQQRFVCWSRELMASQQRNTPVIDDDTVKPRTSCGLCGGAILLGDAFDFLVCKLVLLLLIKRKSFAPVL